ncbi:MAG: alpha-D-ribose 1-methylphosphonate 5-triphosphate diphosphatase [Pseudomonadota bacterium]
MTVAMRLCGAQVLTSSGLTDTPLHLEGGAIVDGCAGREVDLSGYWILPGIVDVHGDAFEKHLAPRRGAMKSLDLGLMATEAELASNGITTGTLAQFYSWEGGMRGPEFARQVFEALEEVRPRVDTTLVTQLRFETHMLEDYDAVLEMVDRFGIPFVVFNDHLPHEPLAKGKTPPGHVGKSLKAGFNPEKNLERMNAMHAARDQVPDALSALAPKLAALGVRMGSHDENTPEQRQWWHDLGAHICEFPETIDTAEAAKSMGDVVIMGSPNLVRGASHKGNVSAVDVVTMGHVDALASDYHYPSLRRAAFLLADSGVCDLAGAWRMISEGPARVLGLEDRGRLDPGQRADLVVIDPQTRDICVTIAGGRVTYMRGEAGDRFLA